VDAIFSTGADNTNEYRQGLGVGDDVIGSQGSNDVALAESARHNLHRRVSTSSVAIIISSSPVVASTERHRIIAQIYPQCIGTILLNILAASPPTYTRLETVEPSW